MISNRMISSSNVQPMAMPIRRRQGAGGTSTWHFDPAPAELCVVPGCLAKSPAIACARHVHAQTDSESVPSTGARSEMGFVSTHLTPQAPASISSAPFRSFSVLTLGDSAQDQRVAELHGRPVEVEDDQLELAREVVPVTSSVPVPRSEVSGVRCVDPRREELAREPGSLDQSMRLTCPAQRSFRWENKEMTWLRAELEVH
jgi:hypothetical protein